GLAAMVVGFGVLDRSRSLSDALVTLFVTVEIVTRLRRYATDFHRRSDAARATALLAVLDPAPANAADTITGAFRVRDLLTQGMVTPLSFDLARGQSLSVYGASGSGKSSLVDVLLGLRAPLSGSVSRAHLTTGLIRPSASFFRASVRENLGLGTASDVDILATLEALGLGRSRYAELDVVLSDDGSQMSSGERVRLALARALLAGVEVLVFDDVAMLLDDESRHLVAESVTNRDLTLIEVTQGARIVVTPDFLVPLGEI
ncbi:MAG: ATP-binding cassette domain-containing protein, partial [Actinomycetota bacterium]